MSVTSLGRSLIAKPGFQARLDRLTLDSVILQFPSISRSDQPVANAHDWHYLLMCASVLSQAIDSDCEEAALRIAHHCLATDLPAEFHDVTCVLFDTLTNRPAIDLAQSRLLVQPDVVSRLPLKMRMEWIKRAIRQTVVTGRDKELTLNRFQRELWDLANSSDYLSVSAPTSTGKSYAFCHWLSSYILHNPLSVTVYIVPTRALIYQVENDLREHFAKELPFTVNVSSLPIASSLKRDQPNVFVLTQERLHILLLNIPPDHTPNLLIVDEAQKVGDGARGVLLQNVIAMLSSRSPRLRVFFASPMVSNPELLLESLPRGPAANALKSTYISVNQNLIWASQVPRKPLIWQLELCLRGTLVPLGTITLPFRPTPSSKRLTFVAKTLGDPDGGNLIYVNGAAEAETAAHQLWGLAGAEADRTAEPEIKNLIDLVKRVVHPDYGLAFTLQRGVAFHYGNMPLLIRSEIERLFKANHIQFLVCTATLIEGVNLPCKSIFVRGPRKGKGKPMNETDFWNLAGRAGRLGQEFQGNVVCIDPRTPSVWPIVPPKLRGTYPIKRASDSIFDAADQFLAYLEAEPATIPSQPLPAYDHLFTFLIREQSTRGSLASSTICDGLTEEMRARVERAVTRGIEAANLPLNIIERNPGISPFAMSRLRHYFEGREGPLEELIPVLPESEDAVDVYVQIFQRINSNLGPIFANNAFGLAILVVHWMRGYPLARIIRDRITYRRRRSAKLNIPALIRQTMEDVEQYARFIVPKYISCYNDILTFHLANRERRDLADIIPDVHIWLEFGASQETQLSMMGLGLSRTAAVALSEFIADDRLSEDKVLLHLAQLNLETLNVPAALIAEVRRLLAVRTLPNQIAE